MLIVAAILNVPSPAFCDAAAGAGIEPDSTAYFSVAYTSIVGLKKDSEPFPWNDPIDTAHLSDRLSAWLYLEPARGLAVFLKGATGVERLRGDLYQSGIVLDQGHVEFIGAEGKIGIRLFTRERKYGSGSRLLRLVSDDAAFLEGRGEGVALHARPGNGFALRYSGAVIHDRAVYERHGGLPVLYSDGGSMNHLAMEFSWSWLRMGFSAAEARVAAGEDATLVSLDLGLQYRRVSFIAELADAGRGRWSDRDGKVLFGFDPQRLRPNALSPVFGPSSVFAAEIHGLELTLDRLGDFGLIPAYSYYGVDVYDPLGETRAGMIESKIISWWRHPELFLVFSTELSDGYRFSDGRQFTMLRAELEEGFKGGVRCSQGMIAADGRRTSFILSFLDDNIHSRIRASIRMDDTGRDNRFYYLVEGIANLSSSISLRTTLYLEGSSESYYSTGIELRPSERFLFRVDAGSFMPFDGSLLLHGVAPDIAFKDRMITFFTRIWFGGR